MIIKQFSLSLRRPSYGDRSLLLFILWVVTTICCQKSLVVTAAVESNSNDSNKDETIVKGSLREMVEEMKTKKEESVSDENTVEVIAHQDSIEDSMFDPLSMDPSCNIDGTSDTDCYAPPKSTIEVEEATPVLDATCFKGGDDYDELEEEGSKTIANKEAECSAEQQQQNQPVDKHWGNNPEVLKMRDQLRMQAQENPAEDKRPPIFLLPGLASTRLVAWKVKKCLGAFSSDIKVQDNVWLNINLVVRMGTVDVDCMKECLRLGVNQSDTDNWEEGCKLRPDEGLDAIASLAPGGIGSSLLVGGTNTVYAWLIQWLADNLGYDVTNIVGLPYDWRLSPDKMEARDGFLSMTRRRIEAAVASNGNKPGIMVAHSMGNLVFRYFLEWLRVQMREEAYEEYVKRSRRRARRMRQQQQHLQKQQEEYQKQQEEYQKQQQFLPSTPNPDETVEESWTAALPGWMTGVYEWLHSEGGEHSSSSEDEDGTYTSSNGKQGNEKNAQLWELAVDEGDIKWLEWIETHLWTYVGLSAPMLGAVNPMRAVISGENMGLPIADEVARDMEVTFGSTHTINPVSTSTGFCDELEVDGLGNEEPKRKKVSDSSLDEQHQHQLACLDDIANEIEWSSVSRDPWKNFRALKNILRDRLDWNTKKPMIDIEIDHCGSGGGKNCQRTEVMHVGPKDAESGKVFNIFSNLWKEEGDPLIVKREQLEQSFFSTNVANILNKTWDRPLIKHVIMAYGVDIPTEVGYIYNKQYHVKDVDNSNKTGGVPVLAKVLKEGPRGNITIEWNEATRGGVAGHFIKKKPKRVTLDIGEAQLAHSGDGSVPYLSLSWAHTWLLHAARAKRVSDVDPELSTDQKSALDYIEISHRPTGATEWVAGPPPDPIEDPDEQKLKAEADTGTDHPHGTRYKPEMIRFYNVGKSRTTGIVYTTSLIEAIGVEHKETTRNYDILAAVFTDVLKYMHDDLGLVQASDRT